MGELNRREFLRNGSLLVSGMTASYHLAPAIAAQISEVGDSTAVRVQPLEDGWEFVRMPLDGPWQAWSDQPLAPWQSVTIPHCFNSYDGCDPDVPAYRGKGWYRRRVAPVNPYPNGRTLLHFEGVGQSAAVYVGNSLAMMHTGGYDEFVVDITDMARVPENSDKHGLRLSMECDNSPDLNRMPSDLSDFTLYGGLYRAVRLVHVPAVALEMVHIEVKASAEQPASVRVRARIHNPLQVQGSAYVTTAITDPKGKLIEQSQSIFPLWDGVKEIASVMVSTPVLWSPRMPGLYECAVTLRTDYGDSVQRERFGIRYFEFQEHGPFFLNGERLLLRGTHRHQDHAGCAAAMTAEQIRSEMEMIRRMGSNFIRLAHYQQPQEVLDLCDELGILVWEELPWCRAGVGGAEFQHQGREKLRTMIEQHYNHPSIILWGLGNEDDWPGEYPAMDRESIRNFMSELNAVAHEIDPGRSTSFRRCDFARDIPDVYSPSIWAGWYGGRYQNYQASLEAAREQVKHLLHIEWGADSHAGRHAEDPYKLLAGIRQGDTAERGLVFESHGGPARVSRDGDWSETYACDLFDWHLKTQESLPWLAGAAQWIFKDFTTPLRVENPIPRVNQKGVVARDLTAKESYYVFQSYWSEEPMVHIYGHSWPVRWGKPEEPRLVRVYSNCQAVELFLNGKSVGVHKRESLDFPCAGLRWKIAFLAGENTLLAEGKDASGHTVTDTIHFHYQTEAWGEPSELRLLQLGRVNDVVRVEATLHDGKGVLCLDARDRVRFTLAGEGQLVDNLGTVGGSRVVELANGRAWIGVKGAAASTAVGVTCKGVVPATLLLS